MSYYVEGKVTFTIDIDIDDATSEEDALAKATERLNDFYHLKTRGAAHNIDSVKLDLEVGEYQ